MNPVQELRKSLQLNQHEFARLVGCSYSSIQNYEGGKKVPREIVERMRQLAVERGQADIAVTLSSEEWQIRSVFHPGETFISTLPPGKPAAGLKYKHQKWHDMLEAVLESGNPRAIDAVQSNLLVFTDYIG